MTSPRHRAPRLVAPILVLGLGGCEKAMQDMYRQPRYDPLERSSLFADGSSSRTPVPGTLAVRTGGIADATGGRLGASVPAPEPPAQVFPVMSAPASGSSGSDVEQVSVSSQIPFEVTAATFRRGHERFDIYCAPCHSVLGDGDGMVVRRGFPAPPSYHSERLRGASDRHFYSVITHGYGAMYPYADRLTPEERWAVVAYIRALQLSQHAPLSALDAHDRTRLAGGSSGNG